MADPLVAVVVNQRQLWAFGSRSTEVFWNSGDPLFPISRVDGSLMEFGCAAKGTPQKLAGTIAWLSDGGQVLIAVGYQPQRISNFAVENAIRLAGDVSSATAFSYKQNGHIFYVLQLPNTDTSWVYDISTKQWHERVDLVKGELKQTRMSCHAAAYNLQVVGDAVDGRIYSLDKTVSDIDGDVLLRRRIAPHLTNNLHRLVVNSFQLDLETGLGLDTGQGVDPQVMLRVSRDWGYTWGSERWTTTGPKGSFRSRAIWRQLGQARDWVFEVTITDPVRVSLLGATVDAVGGVS